MTERDPYSKQLEPLGPEDAYDWWLEQAEDEYAPSTLYAYSLRVEHLVEFCQAEGIENLNELTGRDLFRFRTRLKKERGLNDVSLKSKLTAVRSFVKWCESINACREALHRDVVLPSLDYKEDVRDS
jgi:site-specific recombinase XerC